jgi:hypothetical protein
MEADWKTWAWRIGIMVVYVLVVLNLPEPWWM